jgi:hypothetical protein
MMIIMNCPIGCTWFLYYLGMQPYFDYQSRHGNFSTLHETKNQNFMNCFSPFVKQEKDSRTGHPHINHIWKWDWKVWQRPPYLKTFTTGKKQQQNYWNWRGCFSPIHERRKLSRTGEGGLGFVASKMDVTNTKMPREKTTIKLTNLNSCMNNFKMFINVPFLSQLLNFQT